MNFLHKGVPVIEIAYKHLRKGPQKVVGTVGVADTVKCCHAPVAHAVKLHLVIGHNFPKQGMPKGTSREPQEINMLFAFLPETSCQGLLNKKALVSLGQRKPQILL